MSLIVGSIALFMIITAYIVYFNHPLDDPKPVGKFWGWQLFLGLVLAVCAIIMIQR